MKNKKLYLYLAGIFVTASALSSCEKDLKETIPATPKQPTTTAQPDTSQSNFFFSGKRGIVKKGTFRGQPITYEDIDGQAIWQGDIILSPEDLAPVDTTKSNSNARVKGAGAANKDHRWKNGVVPYVISPFMNNAAIAAAIAEWEKRTPLRFKVMSNEPDYIWFVPSTTVNRSDGIGRKGGQQKIELLNKDHVGIIVHEIGHAIGLVHEHARSDRFNHITFYPENLQEGLDPNGYFSHGIGVVKFDHGNFDFNSIMLYGSFDNGRRDSKGNRLAVFRRKDNGATWGSNVNRGTLSSGDIQTVNAMYSNIYVVQGDHLYAVNPMGGEHYSHLGGGWLGAAQTIAEDDRYILGIQGGMLWRTDRLTGSFQQFGNGNWNGAVGVTGKDPLGNLYAQAGDYLWKIDKNGVHRTLGGGGWKGTQAMYYLKDNTLVVIWKGELYNVSTETGDYRKVSSGWSNVKAMAAVRRQTDELFIMKGDELWRYNRWSGHSYFVKGGFKNTTAMTGVGGRLYIASDGWLHKVDEKGNKIWTVSGYKGVTSMGATHYSGLFN